MRARERDSGERSHGGEEGSVGTKEKPTHWEEKQRGTKHQQKVSFERMDGGKQGPVECIRWCKLAAACLHSSSREYLQRLACLVHL